MKLLMILLSSIGAILLGLPYIFHAFGPTEKELVTWGWLSLGAGLLLLSMGLRRSHKRPANLFLSLGYSGLALLQVLPILLWFTFHGSGISDGIPPSTFLAHWVYSIPHIALLAISLLALYQLWRFPTPSLRRE